MIKLLSEKLSNAQRRWLIGNGCARRNKLGKLIGYDWDKAAKLGYHEKFNSNKNNKNLPVCPNCKTNKFMLALASDDAGKFNCGKCQTEI